MYQLRAEFANVLPVTRPTQTIINRLHNFALIPGKFSINHDIKESSECRQMNILIEAIINGGYSVMNLDSLCNQIIDVSLFGVNP